MVVRVSSEELVRQLTVDAHFQIMRSVQHAGGGVDDKSARRSFDPFVLSVYEGVKQGEQPVEWMALQQAVEAAAKKAVAAASGKSGQFSHSSLAKLPATLKPALNHALENKTEKVAKKMALHEPFPLGKVETRYVFGRYLGLMRAQAAEKIMAMGQMSERLPELLARVKAEGPIEVGGYTIRAAGDGPFIKLGTRSVYPGPTETKLVIEHGEQAVTIGWEEGEAAERRGAKLVLNRYDKKAPDSDDRGSFSYTPPGSSMEDLAAELAAKYQDRPRQKKDPEEALLASFGGTLDLEAAALVTRALFKSHGDTPAKEALLDRTLERLDKKAAQVMGEWALKVDLAGEYQKLVDLIEREGALTLGDHDRFISIEDRFTRGYSGGRKQKLLEGKGPLLVIDGRFGGLAQVVPLASLKKGGLELHIFHEVSPLGRLELNKKGELKSAPHIADLHRVAVDLLESLPSELDQVIGN